MKKELENRMVEPGTVADRSQAKRSTTEVRKGGVTVIDQAEKNTTDNKKKGKS